MISSENKLKIKNWISKIADSPYRNMLINELSNCKSILDVGYGVSSPLGRIPKKFYLEGIDMLPVSKKNKIHDKCIKADIRQISKFYKKKSFDGAVVLDVIEHLTKQEGIKLIRDLEKIVNRKIIIITPEGYHHQEGIHGNPYMEHHSGWKKKEFEDLGFKVNGLHGLKSLRGEEASIKYKPWYLWLLISHITQFVTYFVPEIAFHLLAVKNLKK